MAVFATAVLLACHTDEPSRVAVQRDSAGIAIREYPAAPSTQIEQIHGVEAVSIGALEGAESETFNRIGDLATDSEGRLHVLDAGDQLVKVYEPDGTWVRRYGGKGEGPAEFQAASLLIPLGDSMGVYDVLNQKIALFDPDGSLITTRRWEVPVFELGFPSELAPIPGGFVGVFQTGCTMPPPQERRPTWRLLTLGPEGAVKDTITVRFRGNSIPLYGERFCAVIPRLAGAGYELAVQRDGTAAFTTERAYEVLILRLSARGDAEYQGAFPIPEQILRRTLEPMSVTTAQIQQYRDRYLTSPEDDPIGPDRAKAVRQALDSTDVPENYPQIDALLWDDTGRLWVGRTVVGNAPDQTWDIYDGEGHLVAEAVLPANLGNVLVADGTAWGTVQDELGVMYVKAYRLEATPFR